MSLFGLGRGGSNPAPQSDEELGELLDAAAEPDVPEPAAGQDVAEIIDASMRQVADRVQAMSSTLDSFQQDRKAVDTRLATMDERMRKLSMLTEMISSRYNPFIAPEAPAPAPAANAGGPAPGAYGAGNGNGHARRAAPPPPEIPMSAFPEHEENPLPIPPRPTIAVGAPPKPAARESLSLPPPPSWTREPDGLASAIDLQRNLAQLALSEHLLTATTRGGALDLLAYYEQLGWIGPKTRKELLAAMEGLPAAFEEGEKGKRPRRFPAEFHARTLALVLRVRGLPTSPNDVLMQWRELARVVEG